MQDSTPDLVVAEEQLATAQKQSNALPSDYSMPQNERYPRWLEPDRQPYPYPTPLKENRKSTSTIKQTEQQVPSRCPNLL